MPNYHLFASQVKDGDNTLHKKKSPNNKHSIHLDLLYRRLECISVKTLLSANKADVWDDSYITVQNDIISTSDHHIATIHKQRRNLQSEPDKALKPGQMLCLDLIYSPPKKGLAPETTFKYYILAVDSYSRYPFLQGLYV